MKAKLGPMLSVMLAFAIAIACVPALSESFPFTAYANDPVRLRRSASSSSDILAVIGKGDAVLVTGAQGDYYAVQYEGRSGYVVSSFLTPGARAATPAPGATPNPAYSNYSEMKSGASGAKAKALQEALAELGFYTAAADGKYGSGTANAVRDFQEKNGLAVTGVADPACQYLLFEGTPRNKDGVKTDVKTLPPIPGYTMRPGDRGDAVKAMQERLILLGYYKGTADGSYGDGTRLAVAAFQRDRRLSADGIAGPDTQAALSVASATPAPVVTPAPTPYTAVFVTPAPGEATYPYSTTVNAAVNLRKGTSASSMRFLTIPAGGGIQVLQDTGKYLKVGYRSYVGYVDESFVNVPEQYLDGKTLPVDSGARSLYETLAPGSLGVKVRALQQALAELGFYSGPVDGSYGAGTVRAVKALQGKNGLRETGVALPELQQLIYEKRVRNSRGKLVYVNTLAPVEGLTMREGDTGDAVLELNQMLISAGHLSGQPGSAFTRATAQAVRAFQKAHSIKETGKADSFTVLALRTYTRPQATQPPNPVNTPITQDNVVVIRSGTRGEAVTRLQRRLVELGYYSATPDGIYDSDDIAAVRQFQRVNGLTVSNVADLATQQTLFASYALPASQGGATPAPADEGGVLRVGTFGDAVRAMQSRLITLKYLSGRADGIFGTQTAEAVAAFQKANSLASDGIAGPRTLGVLYSASAKPYAPAATATPPPNTTPAALKLGASGPAVLAMQQRLIALKYLTGTADGVFGPRTYTALTAFQRNNRLDPDGIAGTLTLARLNSSGAVANTVISPVPTPTVQPPTPTFTAPRASEVRFANWYTEVRSLASQLRNVVIYDFMSGTHYNFRIYSLGKHADGTTLTAQDTAVMNKALGVNNWTPRPVWVIFSNGRVYMASTHSHGHEVDYIPG
ncbi:MAG TPA: peptidoglycan-binding protein, partial [Candidatus Limnocylindria bacterium]|nr:peptidoglycan-binding protein [Candidatus Limnocylindria bacterium]